jgi:Tfp pilus assembly protein PilE
MIMRKGNLGFGGLQVVMVVAAIAVIGIVAVPKYQSFMTKAKLTEAFNLAGESRKKASEFYTMNSRFPKTRAEAEMLKTTTLSPPEYVRELVVEPANGQHDLIVKVFLKEGVVENLEGAEQFIYVAGNLAPGNGYAVSWSCGASGIDSELLPEDCRS